MNKGKRISFRMALASASAVTVLAAQPADAGKTDADKILRQMSEKLGAARTFRFKAHRTADAALRTGNDIPADARIEVWVMRPNGIMARSASKDDVRRIYADGATLSVLDEKMNLYATVPMPASLDSLPEQIDKKYGFTPPLAEFAVSDLYQALRRQARTVSYLGQSQAGGDACYRLALSGKVADAQLWIAVTDQLPRKLVATFKDRPGKPQLKVEFSDWDLAAKVDARDFTFVPPKGAMKVPMRTAAEMKAAMKKTAPK